MTGIRLAWPPALGEAGAELDDEAIIGLFDTGGEPTLRMNFVSSADGAVTHGGVSGELSDPADKRVFGLLRRISDVVLVGAGTVRVEGYDGLRVGEQSVRWRLDHGLPAHPRFAIATGSLELDPASPVFTDAVSPPILVTTERAYTERAEQFRKISDLVITGEDSIDVAGMLAALHERGLTNVLCEGGPTLFGTLLAADAVTELCLTISPRLESGAAGRIATGILDEPRGLHLAHALVAEDTLLLRYKRAAGAR